jgi:hypothetical protein
VVRCTPFGQGFCCKASQQGNTDLASFGNTGRGDLAAGIRSDLFLPDFTLDVIPVCCRFIQIHGWSISVWRSPTQFSRTRTQLPPLPRVISPPPYMLKLVVMEAPRNLPCRCATKVTKASRTSAASRLTRRPRLQWDCSCFSRLTVYQLQLGSMPI